MTDAPVGEEIARVHREEWARVVASLARRFKDLDTAEDAAAEAFAAAVERWPDTGIPPNSGGWLTTTATRRAIDRIRRESQREAKHQAAWMLTTTPRPSPPDPPRTTGCGSSSPAVTSLSRRRPGWPLPCGCSVG